MAVDRLELQRYQPPSTCDYGYAPGARAHAKTVHLRLEKRDNISRSSTSSDGPGFIVNGLFVHAGRITLRLLVSAPNNPAARTACAACCGS